MGIPGSLATRTDRPTSTFVRPVFVLGLLVLACAGALRLASLDAGWFGVDQARDATWASEIAAGSAFPRFGPPMRNRLHLGATYYYFWSIPALFTDSPLGGYAFAGVLGTAAVAATGFLAARIAGPLAGIVAMAWLAVHPMAVIDSRIAWAPAALPLAAALGLLASRALLLRPTLARAALLGGLAALATQLHLSAVSLLLVAVGVLVSTGSRLGRRGWAAALAAAAMVLAPMVLAPHAPDAATAVAPMAGSPYANRFGDYAFLVSRWMKGLTPESMILPLRVSLWLPLEIATVLLPIAAWFALWPVREVRERPTLVLVLGAFAATTLVPLFLPAVLWAYYFDASLVPGAICIGLLVATPGRSRSMAAALVALVVVAHLPLLSWWIGWTRVAGYVPTNLDFLRVGGPRPVMAAARAQVLGLRRRQELAEVILDAHGPGGRPLRDDLHGEGFAAFDTDNGFFLQRALRERERSLGPTGAGSSSGSTATARRRGVLVVPASRVPPSWIDAMDPPRFAGGLVVRGYAPRLRSAEGVVENCGDVPLPRRRELDPLEYGSGEQPLTAWPCSPARVVVPFDASDAGSVTRVFPVLRGSGRIVGIESLPAGERLFAGLPDLREGILLPPGAGRLQFELALDGPVDLDLVELHGRRPAVDSEPSGGRSATAAGAPGPASG